MWKCLIDLFSLVESMTVLLIRVRLSGKCEFKYLEGDYVHFLYAFAETNKSKEERNNHSHNFHKYLLSQIRRDIDVFYNFNFTLE